jgi:hypothetical protein
MKKSVLLCNNGLELKCVILSEKPFISGGSEVLVYCQNRLVKGYFEKDYVAEINIIVDFITAPELDEFINDTSF